MSLVGSIPSFSVSTVRDCDTANYSLYLSSSTAAVPGATLKRGERETISLLRMHNVLMLRRSSSSVHKSLVVAIIWLFRPDLFRVVHSLFLKISRTPFCNLFFVCVNNSINLSIYSSLECSLTPYTFDASQASES
jgi:hypothetical protein